MAYKKLHGGVARDDERGVPCCAREAMAMVVQYTLICRIMCRPCTQFRTFSLNRRRVQYTVVGNSVSSREHTGWLCSCPALLRISIWFWVNNLKSADPTLSLTLLSGWYAEPRIIFRGSCQCVGCSVSYKVLSPNRCLSSLYCPYHTVSVVLVSSCAWLFLSALFTPLLPHGPAPGRVGTRQCRTRRS